jgi:tetratricopeptide (TPR) repeat protein
MSLRYAQGHSFSNLGFAYGQLGQLEKSQEQFTHALQAAKDCQDFRGQWQAYEGLSAVHFQLKDYEKAVNCLKTALTILPLGGVDDNDVQERMVAKLSNALEYQLTDKQTSKQTGKQPKVGDRKELPKEPRGKGRNIKIQVDTHMGIDGSFQNGGQDNDGPLQDNDPQESSPKVGHVRPREKNHKFVARGLHIDEPSSDNEQYDASDSTFDTISSYSGNASSSVHQDPSEPGSVHQLQSNLESTAGSTTLPPPKKDPLNNTYEEPQDIIHVIETGRLRLHDLPPGPRDTLLASMQAEDFANQQIMSEHPVKAKKKSTICVIQ